MAALRPGGAVVIVVDEALAAREREGRPVRVAVSGAGFMGRAIVAQLQRRTAGVRVVAVANRTLERARDAYGIAGVDDAQEVTTAPDLAAAIARGRPVVSRDAELVAGHPDVDVLVEVTGTLEHGAATVLAAIAGGTHVVSMNAELEATVGAALATRADAAGVILTSSEGDQPGVQANLVRFVRGLGLEPLVCGNVKGLQDVRRNPTTQEGFARRWGQDVRMVTSFADGTKISFEQAVVANAYGMTVERRGMRGDDHDGHVDELVDRYDVDELRRAGGYVDYVVGARPGPGVFVLAAEDDPFHRHYLELYKLGTGPLYAFYQPYHLCHLEVPSSVGRVALLGDAVLRPVARPTVDVVTTAKVDLRAGTVLDGIGGYHTYGQAERADVGRQQRLLPMGLAEGCRLVRDVPADQVLTRDDVELPEGRLIDRLRREQDASWVAEDA